MELHTTLFLSLFAKIIENKLSFFRYDCYLVNYKITFFISDPVMIIIGTMSKLDFLSYMFKMISLQSEIATHGRIELFVIMRPGDYLVIIL